MNPIPALKFVARVAVQNILRNRGIALASLLTITLTLLGAGVAVVVVHALDGVLHTEESQASVLKVFMADHVAFASEVNLEQNLDNPATVAQATFENKDQAAQQAGSTLGLTQAINLLERSGAGNPLPASLNFHLRNIKAVSALNREVRTSALLDSGPHPTDYNADVIPRLERYIFVAQLGGGLVVAVVGAVALVIITISVRTAAYVRRREIEIMKLVGATDWFVRWPFVLEGVIVGVVSALVASVILLGLGLGFGGGHSLALGVGVRFAALTVLALIVAGGALGSVGSFVGVRRSLAT
ncbi:MAG TPA: permease-like cell division protein FtsX [Candidatus Dormibacteraeota bacterium]|nr:permease-like cell division protein FtsX [Candidatus Dormibacteraeota bacterium]